MLVLEDYKPHDFKTRLVGNVVFFIAVERNLAKPVKHDLDSTWMYHKLKVKLLKLQLCHTKMFYVLDN